MATQPPEDLRKTLTDGEEDPILLREETMESDQSPAGTDDRAGLIVAGIVAVVILIIAGLLLPPISLLERLGGGGTSSAPADGAAGGESALAQGEFSLALAGTAGDVQLDKVSQAAFLGRTAGESWTAAASALPTPLTLNSDVYTVSFEGTAPEGAATLALPAGAEPLATLDLYGWDSQAWRFVPSQIDGDQVVATVGPIYQAYVLAQAGPPAAVEVAAELLPTQSLAADLLPVLSEVTAGTLTLVQGGELVGDVVEVPEGGYRRLLRATNVGVVVDVLPLAILLSDAGLQSRHIADLVAQASDGDFAGVNLDYQGLSLGQRAAFSRFVAGLADALHAEEMILAVTLETPVQNTDSQWDSGGHDWTAIGQAADIVYAQLPLNPAAYGDGGSADQLLAWAARQVERYKLTPVVSASAVDGVGDSYLEMANSQALANFGQVTFVSGADQVEPGTPVEVSLSGSAGALSWDPASLSYKYNYEQAGQQHTVWLSNEAALSHRLRFAPRHNMRGIAIRGLGRVEESAGYLAAIESYLGAAETPQPAGAAIVWTVEDESGGVIASSSGDALTYRWEDTDRPGGYTIAARLAQGEGVADLGSLNVAVREPEPTATPEPTAEPVVEATATPASVAATNPGAAAPPGSFDPGNADAVVNTVANLRTGPGLAYGTLPGGAQAGTRVSLIGRNSASDWLQVRLPDGETEAWIFRQLLTINTSVNVNALAVVEVPPPAGGGGGGSAPPPVGAPPVATGGGYEIGGQTHSFANPQLMAYAGMNWVKFQHKWGPGDDPGAVAGRIQQAHANGFKVLLSMPGANVYPSSIDFAGYVDFLGGVAALGPDAIEVWNEMNIDFEWPAGQIDPSSYVNNMLAPAYNRIKSVNPNVMVVSGAPAPTGFDNGHNAWADNRYMAGVAAAGGGSYMDCVGVHYNAGATSPNAQSGHPAGGHYSWYFWGTLNVYYNAFGGGRRLCFTELGFLSGEDYGGVPARFSWAANTTVGQHAAWLAEAVSLAGSSGKVRMLIIFNVDFTHYGDDPQAGYAMIRPGGSCPACETLRQVTGGR